MALNVLSHLWPKVGSGNFEVRLVGRIVSSENTVMCLAHGFFPVPGREVQRCPGIVEIVQPDPDEFVLILKELFDHGRVVGLVLLQDCRWPFAGVSEGLDALQYRVLHLEVVEICLERVKS